MRSRCLVVSLALLSCRKPLFTCAMLALALFTAHSPLALAEGTFTLTSTSFHPGGTVDNAQVFNQDDCKGGNRSPQLTWRDAPAGTRSFAITMFDQDAPGRGWWHWAVAGIPATVDRLPENASSSGYLTKLGAVEARNDFETDGYGGPCPPPGKPHRYVLTLTALGIDKLPVPDDASGALVGFNVGAHSLAKGTITAQYGR